VDENAQTTTTRPHSLLPPTPHINHSPLVLIHVPQTRYVRMSPVVVYPEQCVRFGPEERSRIRVRLRQSLERHLFPRRHRRGGMDPPVRPLPEHGVVIDDVLVGHGRSSSPTTTTTTTTTVVVVVVVVAMDATERHRRQRRGLPPMQDARAPAHAAVGVVRRTASGRGGGRRFASDDADPGRTRTPPSMPSRTSFVSTMIDDDDGDHRRRRSRRRRQGRRRGPASIVMPQVS